MHLANKTGDENKKAFMYKGNLSRLTGWDWGGWIFKTLIGSVYISPPKKRLSSYMNTLKYSREKNHHKTTNN